MSTVKLITNPEQFKPITLSITLESQEEVHAIKLLAWRDVAELSTCLNDNISNRKVAATVLSTLLLPILAALPKE